MSVVYWRCNECGAEFTRQPYPGYAPPCKCGSRNWTHIKDVEFTCPKCGHEKLVEE